MFSSTTPAASAADFERGARTDAELRQLPRGGLAGDDLYHLDLLGSPDAIEG